MQRAVLRQCRLLAGTEAKYESPLAAKTVIYVYEHKEQYIDHLPQRLVRSTLARPELASLLDLLAALIFITSDRRGIKRKQEQYSHDSLNMDHNSLHKQFRRIVNSRVEHSHARVL